MVQKTRFPLKHCGNDNRIDVASIVVGVIIFPENSRCPYLLLNCQVFVYLRWNRCIIFKLCRHRFILFLYQVAFKHLQLRRMKAYLVLYLSIQKSLFECELVSKYIFQNNLIRFNILDSRIMRISF